MNRKFCFITVVLALSLLAISGCAGLIPQTSLSQDDQTATQVAFIQQAAKATATTMAMETQISKLQTQIAAGGSPQQPAEATATSLPAIPATATAVPTATAIPTATAVPPTATPLPTATPVPPTATPLPPTATPIPCNSAQFVADVTIPDGTQFAPGSAFTKTWRLKNNGSCTWTTAYDIVFTGGSAMSAPSSVEMPGNVAPGQVIDVSVGMIAPSKEGTYVSNWKLRDAGGVLFGLGRTGASFYAEIKVSAPAAKYPLDMVASMCSASWTSGAGALSCPSPDGDSRGYVIRLDKPTLETGYIDDEPALRTHPQMVDNGWIRGKYPAFRVESGDHFLAIIGCASEKSACDVKMQLDYQIGDNSIQTLKVWHEVFDEMIRPVDVDLSSLAGKDVKFILTVNANGSSNQDWAQWLAPRIVKK